MLTREQLTKNALKRDTVKTSIGDIRIQEIDAQSMVDYVENYEGDKSSSVDKQAKMCQLSIIDDKGKRMYADDEVDELKRWSFRVLTDLQHSVLILNGMIEDDEPVRPVSKKRKRGN